MFLQNQILQLGPMISQFDSLRSFFSQDKLLQWPETRGPPVHFMRSSYW